ncbi:MAG TPA: uroporphyrinogen decarboxylase family protein [Sumerlaeia bacterium]|nr:uroporphyrinogen decarboxylase family protein [Sumerlaeia bacterium]
MAADFEVMKDALLRRREPPRVPFYEHFLDQEILAEIQKRYYDGPAETPSAQRKRLIETYAHLGYDCLPYESGIRFAARSGIVGPDTAPLSRGQRGWADENQGPIQTWDDLENEEFWPPVEDAFDYAGFESFARELPPGMKIIGGASGGPFEHASFLMGLAPLSLRICEEPEFVERLLERIGTTLAGVAQRLAPLEGLGAYRFGDDMGYKTATMASPAALRRYFLPWAKRVVEAVHAAGKPFVLHSCGNLEAIMEDLIDDVGIDAKHSFEDVIMPVAEAKKRWGSRVALLGGIDVDFLCRHTPREVKDYTWRVLEACAPGGGYALGSGNTIANYVPIENYLAMLEAGRDFNGQT